MNHEYEEMLTALLDGQLSAEQATELRARLDHDPELRELWEQLQAQRQLLRGLPRQKAPQDFLSKVAVALQEQAVEVTPAPGEIEEAGPRGGWRAVFALAAALAALLLVGIFFWPGNARQERGQVAGFDGNNRARQQENEELKRLEQGDWEESAPVQRAPQGPLPKAAELSGERAESSGAAAEPAADMKAMASEQPLAEMAEKLQAQAATDEAMPGIDAMREARRDRQPEDPDESKMAESRGLAPGAPGIKAGQPPAAAASAAPPQAEGGLDAAAEIVGPIEVWVVDKEAPADRAAGGDKKFAASQVEVFFASVAESELPSWLSELQSSAMVTRLDADESRELLTQLSQQNQAAGKKFAANKPTGQAAADVDGPAGLQGSRQGNAAPNRTDEPAAQVGYLGLQQAEPLDALVTRSQMRQQAVPEPAGERQSGAGLGGGGGAAGLSDTLKQRANSTLESNLSGLRARSFDSPQLPEATSGSAGRNVLIIIRER